MQRNAWPWRGFAALDSSKLVAVGSVSVKGEIRCCQCLLASFLYLHASVIAGIDSSSDGSDKLQHDGAQKLQRDTLLGSIASLRDAQRKSSETLQGKMEHALCLLRHFSRMVWWQSTIFIWLSYRRVYLCGIESECRLILVGCSIEEFVATDSLIMNLRLLQTLSDTQLHNFGNHWFNHLSRQLTCWRYWDWIDGP